MPKVPLSSRSVKAAVEPEAALVVVPVSVAPTGLTATEMLLLKLSTSLPETSSARIEG